MLALLIGALLLGLAGWHHRALPAWASAVLVLALPSLLAAFLAGQFTIAWIVLAVLGLTAGLLAVWPASLSRLNAKEAT
jgi:hypothetical protein